jgi:hypothetical protein
VAEDGDILVGAARANTGSTLTLADPVSLAFMRVPEQDREPFFKFPNFTWSSLEVPASRIVVRLMDSNAILREGPQL